jgi:hypothetical protein
MRRLLLAGACLALFGLATGCATSGQRLEQQMQTHNARIEEAFDHSLRASDPWERQLWESEYQRRSREYDLYLEAVRAEHEARGEFVQRLAGVVEQAGLMLLEDALARGATP